MLDGGQQVEGGVQLYWSGGSFQTTIECPGEVSEGGEGLARSVAEERAGAASAVLDEFRRECQATYLAFNRDLNGRARALCEYEALFARIRKTEEMHFYVGN